MQIDFTAGGNSDAFVVSGFSGAELLGRWGSTGVNSSLLVPVPAMQPGLLLSVVLMPMTVADRIATQPITILFLNGILVYQGQCSGWCEIRVSLPPILTGVVTLQFLHPTPVSPASISNSNDSRPLAFLFKQISVTGRDKAPASSPLAVHPVQAVPSTSTVSPDVWVAQDGWLFLIGGTNAVLRYYTDPGYFTDARAEEWAQLLLARRGRLARYGMQYLHLAAPDKISVYPDLVRGDLPNRLRHPITLLQSALEAQGAADVMVNPLPAFASHPQRDHLFLRTDTHWWYEASQAVFELVAERLGYLRRLSLEGRDLRRYRMTFDLGGKVEPAVTEEAFAVATRTGVTRAYANELAEKFEANVKLRKPVVHNGINVV